MSALIELHADFLRKGDKIAVFSSTRREPKLVPIKMIHKSPEGVTLFLTNGMRHFASRDRPLVQVPAETAYRP